MRILSICVIEFLSPWSCLQMSNVQRKELSPAWKATKPFLNGGLSGMAATCIIQPIDMVKVRIQIGAQGGPVSIFPSFSKLPPPAGHSGSCCVTTLPSHLCMSCQKVWLQRLLVCHTGQPGTYRVHLVTSSWLSPQSMRQGYLDNPPSRFAAASSEGHHCQGRCWWSVQRLVSRASAPGHLHNCPAGNLPNLL